MKIKIGPRIISEHHPTLVVAELSANHRQKFHLAVETIKAAKKAGADAVKLQTYTADTITLNSRAKHFRIKGGTLWDGKTLYHLYKEACMPWEWQPKLKKIAEDFGLICFSSPFDKTAVDFLEKMKVPAYKIASFEVTDIPLIEYVAAKGKPVLISTGIATLNEIKRAVAACRRMENRQIALLKCSSSYPTDPKNINLRTIPDLAKRFKTIVGLSDHSRGFAASTAAVVLGARVIERHFILDRKLGGPDKDFSLEPKEFALMVQNIREIEESLGEVTYALTDEVRRNRFFARSLFAVQDIKRGDRLTEANIKSIRPGMGLSPRFLKDVLGKKAKTAIKKGTPLSRGMIR